MQKRIIGLDFARALALLGMFIVNYTVIVGAENNGSDFLISFTHLFEGRASSVFVLLAGIGISLMTRRAIESENESFILEKKQVIWKRSLFLLLTGLILYAVGWTGDILHYYAVYMFITSFFITKSKKTIIFAVSLILIVTEYIQLNMNYLKGWSEKQLFIEYEGFWTVSGFFRHLLYNGYHPVLPWVCFFLIGLMIGRLKLDKKEVRLSLLITSFLLLIATELISKWLIKVTSRIIDYESVEFIFQTGPIPPSIFYIFSNTASAIIIIVLSLYVCEWFSDKKIIQLLVKTGQMSFTHYVSHVFIGIAILVILNRLENESLIFALTFSFLFFIGSVLFSALWSRKFNRGPVEQLMRKITG